MGFYLHMFSPILSLVINIFSQVCICRYISGFSLLKSIFIGFFFGIFSLLFIEFYYFNQAGLSLLTNISYIFANIIAYSALAYVYFHFINLGETGRRIRILRELYDSREGLSLAEILKRYSARSIVEKRIDRLVNSGQIIHQDDKYYIGSPSMLLMAKAIVTMKLIILGRRNEFD